MGSIIARKIEFVSTVSEIIGYKSGLTLSVNDFQKLLKNESTLVGLFEGPFDVSIRIRSEVYENLFSILLHKVGVTPKVEFGFLMTQPENPAYKEMAVEVAPYFVEFLNEVARSPIPAKGVDPRPFVYKVRAELGSFGAEVGLDMLHRFVRHINNSPWSPSREFDWQDTRVLDELFKSEKLESPHGQYFDQRFINFLHSNFEDIGSINWRQFEGLAAEYLQREGYYVELGPGRDDGNIDIRCWTNSDEGGTPPTILVQCKRQQDKVGKVVVKALWADMQDENANSGLIVTTSSLSPGARDVCRVRNYSINEANRQTLQEWIGAMRTPGTGVFLGE